MATLSTVMNHRVADGPWGKQLLYYWFTYLISLQSVHDSNHCSRIQIQVSIQTKHSFFKIIWVLCEKQKRKLVSVLGLWNWCLQFDHVCKDEFSVESATTSTKTPPIWFCFQKLLFRVQYLPGILLYILSWHEDIEIWLLSSEKYIMFTSFI